MEIFDDRTYEILSNAYEEAFDNGVHGALSRAIEGRAPFKLRENEKDYTPFLQEIATYNDKLTRLVARLGGQKGEIVRYMLGQNALQLPSPPADESFIQLRRYENAYLKVAQLLVDSVERAKKEGAKINDIFLRAYCILTILCSEN